MGADGTDVVVSSGGGEGNVSGSGGTESANRAGSIASVEVCSAHFGYCVGISWEIEHCICIVNESMLEQLSSQKINEKV